MGRNTEGELPEPNYRKFKSDGTLANLSYRVLTPDDPHYDRAVSSLGPVSAADAQPTYNLASGGNLASAGGRPTYDAATMYHAATATVKAGPTLRAQPQRKNPASSAGRAQVISKDSPHFYINGHMDTSEDATC